MVELGRPEVHLPIGWLTVPASQNLIYKSDEGGTCRTTKYIKYRMCMNDATSHVPSLNLSLYVHLYSGYLI